MKEVLLHLLLQKAFNVKKNTHHTKPNAQSLVISTRSSNKDKEKSITNHCK